MHGKFNGSKTKLHLPSNPLHPMDLKIGNMNAIPLYAQAEFPMRCDQFLLVLSFYTTPSSRYLDTMKDVLEKQTIMYWKEQLATRGCFTGG